MRLASVLLVGGLVAAAPVRGAPVKVAVLDLRATNVDPSLAKNLVELVSAALQAHPRLSVISRSDVAAMLGFERQKQLLGCDDDSCAAEIAGALGVDRLVTGAVGKVGDTYLLTLQLLDVKSAHVTGRTSESLTGKVDDLVAAVKRDVPELLAQDPAIGGAPPVRLGFWLGGGGVALLAAGAIVGLLQRSAVSDLTSRFDQAGVYDGAKAKQAQALATGANALFIAGGAVALAGAVSFAW